MQYESLIDRQLAPKPRRFYDETDAPEPRWIGARRCIALSGTGYKAVDQLRGEPSRGPRQCLNRAVADSNLCRVHAQLGPVALPELVAVAVGETVETFDSDHPTHPNRPRCMATLPDLGEQCPLPAIGGRFCRDHRKALEASKADLKALSAWVTFGNGAA